VNGLAAARRQLESRKGECLSNCAVA
jgi:hypothetical protein